MWPERAGVRTYTALSYSALFRDLLRGAEGVVITDA